MTEEDRQCCEEALVKMKSVVKATYSICACMDIASYCHAFMEFNGLMSKYVDLCENMFKKDIDFRTMNTHLGSPVPCAAHDIEYFAEKLSCMFGPAVRSSAETRKVFLGEFIGPGFEPFDDLMQLYAEISSRVLLDRRELQRQEVYILPIEDDDIQKMVKMLGALFGPAILATPEARRSFVKHFLGIEVPVAQLPDSVDNE